MLRRFIRDVKNYKTYGVYSAKATLKSEVAGSYLNWLWWILDPLLFMLVYTFIVQVVFNKRMPNFHIYVFIGLNVWKMFNSTIISSASLIRLSKGVLSKVYVPKFIMLASKIYVATFKMVVSFTLVFLMCLFSGIALGLRVLYCIPLLAVLCVVTFGLGLIVMHIGVYLKDLGNMMNVFLRLVYYMSGIFFDIANGVPYPYNEILLKLNPIAFIIQSMRQAIMYNTAPDFLVLGFWLVMGVLFSLLGLSWTYRYENNYVKVV
ncbi:MAG: ABC transporter permease [Clostridia bacterium]|nr:ABC transporter permease [Clostridia bacterium]